MKDYKFEGEVFQLDDSKGCYVEVSYRYLKGYVGVNLGKEASDQYPFIWWLDAEPVTREGLKYGNPDGDSVESNLRALCNQLIRKYRIEEANRQFDREKYCNQLHETIRNLP